MEEQIIGGYHNVFIAVVIVSCFHKRVVIYTPGMTTSFSLFSLVLSTLNQCEIKINRGLYVLLCHAGIPKRQCPISRYPNVPSPSSLTHVHSLRALTTETTGELDVLLMLLVNVVKIMYS
jgi:hypothetical protein